MIVGGRQSDESPQRIPEIGEGHRWYDFPYKALYGLLRSAIGRRLPYGIRTHLLSAINWLHPFHEHNRNKVRSREDTFRNVLVPSEETVTVPALWVVELFPPSELPALMKSLDRNSWDSRRVRFGYGERNQDYLNLSRSGSGVNWWKIGQVTTTPGIPYPDAKFDKLPAAFSSVELTAIQTGSGLTAVVAFFSASDVGSRTLNQEWHSEHAPRISWTRGRPSASDRMWSTFKAVQTSRRSLHDQARSWMQKVLPGTFAGLEKPNPLIDLLLFENYDPKLGERNSREFDDALRALGVGGWNPRMFTSDHFPDLTLDPVNTSMCQDLQPNTWALCGKESKVESTLGENLQIHGSATAIAIARSIDEGVREALRLLSISTFLEELQREFSRVRDAAHMQHRKFTRKRLRAMRDSFLKSSIDLSSTVRDVRKFHRRAEREGDIPTITASYAPWIIREDSEQNWPPMNYTTALVKRQKEMIETLSGEDKEYREILSTVAAIGASSDTFKVGRIALWVSFMSLLVSLVALMLADVDGGTLLEFVKDHLPN